MTKLYRVHWKVLNGTTVTNESTGEQELRDLELMSAPLTLDEAEKVTDSMYNDDDLEDIEIREA
jgi:hypothetical protein